MLTTLSRNCQRKHIHRPREGGASFTYQRDALLNQCRSRRRGRTTDRVRPSRKGGHEDRPKHRRNNPQDREPEVGSRKTRRFLPTNLIRDR